MNCRCRTTNLEFWHALEWFGMMGLSGWTDKAEHSLCVNSGKKRTISSAHNLLRARYTETAGQPMHAHAAITNIPTCHGSVVLCDPFKEQACN